MAERKRNCGGCTVCCTVTAVPELRKPFGITCQFCKDHSCHIYPDRPESCRTFECAWLKGDLPAWARPDKVHVMIEHVPDAPVVLALPEPGHEQWRTHRFVEALRREYVAKGVAVVASDKLALLPDGMTVQEAMADVTAYARTVGVVK